MKGKWWRRGGGKERKEETSAEVSQGGWAEGLQEKDEGEVMLLWLLTNIISVTIISRSYCF